MALQEKYSSFLDTGHQDLIHDFVYDFYGKRLATCSSDSLIKIWKKNANAWTLQQEIRHEHCGSIQRICWAHPKFGDIIASCAADYAIHIFASAGTMFTFKCSLSGPKDVIRDCHFAPPQHGLTLAAATACGKITIYSGEPRELGSWNALDTIEVERSANCLCWNPSKYENKAIAIGTVQGVDIWTVIYNNIMNSAPRFEWTRTLQISKDIDVISISWAPNIGRRYHLVAFGARNPGEPIRVAKIQNEECHIYDLPNKSAGACIRLSWNLTGSLLACALDNGETLVYKYNNELGWKLLLQKVQSEDIAPIPPINLHEHPIPRFGSDISQQSRI